MTLTSVEIFAAILAVLIIVKFLFLLFNKNSWMKFAKSIYDGSNVINWVFGILALIVLYYLLQTMTIVQIYAAALFVVLLMGMAFATYGKEFMKMGEKMLKTELPSSIWINLIIWLILSIWVLYVIFF